LLDLGLDLLFRGILRFFVVGGLQGSDAILRVLVAGEPLFCSFMQVIGFNKFKEYD
jgi:hypothetical protein